MNFWRVNDDTLTEDSMIEMAVRLTTFGVGGTSRIKAVDAMEMLQNCGYFVEKEESLGGK